MTYAQQDRYTSKELLNIWNEQNTNKQFPKSALPIFRFLLDQGVFEFEKPEVVETHPLFIDGSLNKVVA
jgi:hypothetical protein